MWLQAAQTLANDVARKQSGGRVSGLKYRETVTGGDPAASPVLDAETLSEEILAGCDAVYIGTPLSSHSALVIAAISAGKHVLLEKPLAGTLSDANAIVAAAEKVLILSDDDMSSDL